MDFNAILDVNARQTEETPDCAGLFFRGRVNRYFKKGLIREDRRLSLLKRKSCAGCCTCGWIEDQLTEDYYNDYWMNLDDIKSGWLYKLKVTTDRNTDDYDVIMTMRAVEDHWGNKINTK